MLNIAKRPVTYGDITASLREIRPLVIIVPKRVKDIRENPYTGERLAQPPFCTIIAQVNTKTKSVVHFDEEEEMQRTEQIMDDLIGNDQLMTVIGHFFYVVENSSVLDAINCSNYVTAKLSQPGVASWSTVDRIRVECGIVVVNTNTWTL